MKKNLFRIITIFILLISYIYVYNIATIPDKFVLFEGEQLSFKVLKGLSWENENNYETTLTSVSLNNKIGNNVVNLNLFGNVKVKTVNIDVIPTTKVIPLGQAIGMKLYTKGVLVVGMSEIENENKEKNKPYENSGIEEGDSIIAINNNEVTNTSELIQEVNDGNGQIVNITYVKNNQILETSIKPTKNNNEYKLGLWVRDAAAGVGTLTFYEPSTNMFISLGHGISDIDTESIVNIASGELVTANIISIVKGQEGIPGELRGTITNGTTIGKVYKNTSLGVYGIITNKQSLKSVEYNEMTVASREEIKIGKAQIMCEVDNEGVKKYEIEIEKIYVNNNDDNKSMLIKITDKELLDKTGGIIQGMSGAPVMQNGKLIGAITNVTVS